MSYEAINWAMEQPGSPTQKHVLLVLANHANQEGESFPSTQRLCHATGLSDRAVRKARSELIAAGLLVRSTKFTRNGVRFNMAPRSAQVAPDAGYQEPRSGNKERRATPEKPAPRSAQVAPDAGPHNHHLTTNNHHSIPPTPQPKIELPNWMPVEAWDGWLEMRRHQLKKPAGHRAQELAVKKLAALRKQGHDPEAVLDQSTMMNWQGLYPVKADRTGPLPHNVTPFPRSQRPARESHPFEGFADRFEDDLIPELSAEEKAVMRRYGR